MTINTSISSKLLPAAERGDTDRTGIRASNSDASPFQSLFHDRPRPAPDHAASRSKDTKSAPDQLAHDASATPASRPADTESTEQRQTNDTTDARRDGKDDDANTSRSGNVEQQSEKDQAATPANTDGASQAAAAVPSPPTDVSTVEMAPSAADTQQIELASDTTANSPGLADAVGNEAAGDAKTTDANAGTGATDSMNSSDVATADGRHLAAVPDAPSNSESAAQKGLGTSLEPPQAPASKRAKKHHATKAHARRHSQHPDTLQESGTDQATGPTGASKPAGMAPPTVLSATPGETQVGAAGNTANASAPTTSPPTTPANGVSAEHAADARGRNTVSERLFSHPGGSANDAERLSSADRVRLVNRVARAIHSAPEQNGVLRIRLRPAELGALRLEVSVQNGHVSARLETETAAARHVILDSLPQLRDRLADQGMRIHQFHVDVGHGDSNQTGSQLHGRQLPASAKHNPGNVPETTETHDAVEHRVPRAVIAPGKLNVIV